MIQPVEDAVVTYEEEYADCVTPIGYRVIINGKNVDIVVKKFDRLRDAI